MKWDFFSTGVGSGGGREPRFVRLGLVEQTLFNDLLFPLVERCNIRGARLTFRQLADRYAMGDPPLLDVNSPDGIAALSRLQPNLMVCIRYGQILRGNVLNLPDLGILNLHSGLLPQYRGAVASFWSLLHHADDLGMTLHWIDSEAIDAGPIIATTRQPLDSGQSYFSQTLSLYREGVAALINTIATIASGDTPAVVPAGGRVPIFQSPTRLRLTALKAQRAYCSQRPIYGA